MSHQVEVPEHRTYVLNFHQAVKEKNATAIKSLYELWSKVIEKHYKQAPEGPPNSSVIASIVGDGVDQIFLTLYNELFYRYLYAKAHSSVTLENRIGAWENYSRLFNYFLKPDKPVITLPNQWIWDITDEFIYQFQDYCLYKYKVKGKNEEEITQIKNHPQVWNVQSVLKYLYSFVNKAESLEEENDGGDVYKMLGYFCTIGLLRIHCSLGDYHLALKSVSKIDLHKKGLFTQVTACHISLYYYLGFAYMMMRRFVDATKAFSNILLYISRISNKQHPGNRNTSKREGQMYNLLAIVMSFSPMQRIDETVKKNLKEKLGELKMQRIQRGDVAVFEEMFLAACPKFIFPAIPNYEIEDDDYQSPSHQQLKLFMNEVQQMVLLSTIRSYLKLYTSIGIDKLAQFLEMDKEHLRIQLLCYSRKNRNLVWRGGPALEGQWSPTSDTDFYIDGDMIHVVDSKTERRFGEFFIRHINKFDEIIHDALS
eukprot:TRINITY_DN206_c0_g1_i1.p1 TRINITY_DN206_c0_g1~~TRINITY_DN206_c0_g1_i1.p1  ORF type:complete len:496 (-),score=58.76 TRINITY_DN206_c0_g1_i1:24-1469(-)